MGCDFHSRNEFGTSKRSSFARDMQRIEYSEFPKRQNVYCCNELGKW